LKAFKKHYQEWVGFMDFINWWNLDNFQEKDYENFILDNGKSTSSLVESIYIAISKKLLVYPINMNDISLFIPKIAEISKKYSNMQYPPYYYAKLLLVQGDKEKFMDAFLPFAKRKSRDFWVWNLMSDNFSPDSNEYFSCLCKSAACGAPDKFTGDVREKLANLFIVKEQYAEAKFELQKIIDSRVQEGWPLKEKHIRWQNFIWWDDTVAIKNNFSIYNNNLALAESLLYSDVPEDIVVVERVNREKKVLNFIVNKNKYGFFNYSKHKINPKVGEVYAVRLDERKDKTSNFYRVKTIVKSNAEVNAEIYKDITGKLKKSENNSFGFIGKVFVSPQIISKYNLKNGDKIKGKVIQSYNSKRKAWGWNLITIEK
jgi:hypothetical protein